MEKKMGKEMDTLQKKALLKAIVNKRTSKAEAADLRTTTTPYEPAVMNGDIAFHPANPCIVTHEHANSPIAEEYRKLKTVILKMTRQDFRNIIMVTSTVSGEGKSVTCANLAVMLAREYGQSVLLIDADLRRPSLHNYLGITCAQGLADCLEDRIDAGSAIVKTGIPKFSFMSAGKQVANPAELLSSHRMIEFLSEIKHRYRDRYILLDTSPVLLFSETQAMSSHVDGVLLVVKEGASSLKGISHMLDILKGPSMLGIVYNDATTASIQGRQHYHYYNYYSDNRYGKDHEAP